MIKLKKRSNDVGSVPAVGSLLPGEIALNTYDGVIYMEDTVVPAVHAFREVPGFHFAEDIDARDDLIGTYALKEGDWVRYLMGGQFQLDVYYNGGWYRVGKERPFFVMIVELSTADEPNFKDVIDGKIVVVPQANNTWIVYSPDPVRGLKFNDFKDKVVSVLFRRSAHLESTSEMFKGCSSLTACNIAKIDAAHVTDTSSMFEGCTSLPSLKTDMFTGCTSMTQPNTATQANITDANGSNWTNGSSCP